jgi:hypothetical protein
VAVVQPNSLQFKTLPPFGVWLCPKQAAAFVGILNVHHKVKSTGFSRSASALLIFEAVEIQRQCPNNGFQGGERSGWGFQSPANRANPHIIQSHICSVYLNPIRPEISVKISDGHWLYADH